MQAGGGRPFVLAEAEDYADFAWGDREKRRVNDLEEQDRDNDRDDFAETGKGMLGLVGFAAVRRPVAAVSLAGKGVSDFLDDRRKDILGRGGLFFLPPW